MWKSAGFKIVRETIVYFFWEGGHEKLQKTDFFRKTVTPRNLLKEKKFQHMTMLKLSSRRFRKCIIYEANGDFCASYYRSKSADDGKSESVTKIMRCSKKKTRPQFLELRLEIESAREKPNFFSPDSIWRRDFEKFGTSHFGGEKK